MMALLVFPSMKLTAHQAHRIFRWTTSRFSGPPTIAASAQTLDHYRSIFPDLQISVYDRAQVHRHETVVFMEGPAQCYLDDPRHAEFKDVRVYIVSRGCRLDVVNRPIDESDYPALNAHVFNREAPINLGYTFFPYGYLYRSPGFGPIDPFGFRIEADYQALGNRSPNHKLIAVFGGSSAMSIHCLHDEMLTTVLEKKLNEFASSQAASRGQDPLKVTVLNFGVLGHAVLNELLTYILFVDRIRPDIVIGHDAYNDFSYGLVNDEFLLNNHSICYEPNFEQWSRLLHQPGAGPNPNLTGALKIRNQPKKVMESYTARKRQFKSFVEAAGGHFIWGVQPASFSKQDLSPPEREIYEGLASNPDYRYSQTMKILPRVFGLLREELEKRDFGHVVNLDQEFGKFGRDDCLFEDVAHTNARGDEIIAECYFQAVAPLLFSAPLTSGGRI